jgi:hypothetical protein
MLSLESIEILLILALVESFEGWVLGVEFWSWKLVVG